MPREFSMKPREINDFFDRLQKECNFTSMESIKPVYYATLRAILSGLKVKGRIKLPDWGEYRVVVQKARPHVDVNTREHYNLPAQNTVRFSPDGRLKAYVKNLRKEPPSAILVKRP